MPPEGRVYITDATAEAMGGREHVQAIYDRVGDGGHIVIHSPLDTEEQVEFLFWHAQLSVDPFRRDPEELRQAVVNAHLPLSPSMVFGDLDGDGQYDVASYRYIPGYFDEGNTYSFPGDHDLVRDFVTGHEMGHQSHNSHLGENTFWQRWQNERNADQDGFRGMGDNATIEFQRGILAARAGNMLPHMFKSSYNSFLPNTSENANHAFTHSSVLGIFLPGEEGYEVTQEGLNTSLSDFRAKVAGAIHDNHAAQNPDFALDVSELSRWESTVSIYNFQETFNAFIENQAPETAARYEQFGKNLRDLSDQLTRFESMYQTAGDNEAMQKFVSVNIRILETQMRTEFQEAINFMQETDPELLQRYIAEHHPEIILEQTAPETGSLNILDQAEMAQIVLKLRDEGAFDNDPIQMRLANYIEIDMQTRPHLYTPPDPAPENEKSPIEALRTKMQSMQPGS